MKTLVQLAHEADYDIVELSWLVTKQGVSNYSTEVEIHGVVVTQTMLKGTGLELDFVTGQNTIASGVYTNLFLDDLESMMEYVGDGEWQWVNKEEVEDMIQPMILDLLKNIR